VECSTTSSIVWLKRAGSVAALSLWLLGCASEGGVFDPDMYDKIDKGMDLSRDDYRNISLPKGKTKDDMELQAQIVKAPPPIPKVSQILAKPKPPRVGQTKLVSLTVTDDVPLKDVLIELARLADVDIEIGPDVQGGINFRAKDKPFAEVIERVADLASLRYSMKRGVLRVERDLPYLKNYSIDFLNIVRDSSSDISLSTDGGGGGGSSSGGGDSGGGGGGGGSSGGSSGSGGGGGLTTGTTTSITSESASDFWAALESSMAEILNYQPTPELRALAEELSERAAQTENAATAAAAETVTNAASGNLAVRGRNGAFFVINRQAGILTVSASQRQHEEVNSYLELLERNASAQVLIEAKIVEVELDDRYQSGIDWAAAVGNTNFDLSFPNPATNSALISVDPDDNNLGINLDAVVQFVEQFGTSRILSNPRLHAINNQQAVLTFAENRVFFDLTIDQEDATSVDGNFIPGSVGLSAERYTVPIGLILNILPSINMDTSEVTLNVRPTISRQIDTVSDPVAQLAQAAIAAGQTINADVPVIEIRELDSVMKLKSGSVMVIGGLMEDTNRSDETGVPLVSDIPWIGNAFKSRTKLNNKTELIIFIKATIVGSNGGYHQTDRNVYEKYSDDPRPLSF